MNAACRVLRTTAVVIAIAAIIDPTVTRTVAQPDAVSIVVMHEGDVSHAERLQRLLGDAYDTTVRFDDRTAAAACPAHGGCVVVSRGSVPERVTAGAAVLGALLVPSGTRAIRHVASPGEVHRESTAALRVALHQPVSRVDVFDGEVLVGSTEGGGALDVTVPWVPIAGGVRVLRVVAADDAVDVGARVTRARATVLMHEPEPTWIGTFVRRALEDDTRFALRGRVRVAPPVAVSRGDAVGLSPTALQNVAAVIVTSPETLAATDVALLEDFVVRRGGSLVLLPDSRPSGPALRLMPRIAAERREPEERRAGPLRVSEWLTFDRGVGTLSLVSLEDDAVVVSQAIGRGRVITSGALDSWRYRDSAEFNEFWTSAIWDAAALAGPPLRVMTDRILVRDGESVSVNAELQTLARLPDELDAEGELRCGSRRDHVRLWPGPRPGVFEGSIRLTGDADCQIAVAVNDVTQSVPVASRMKLAEPQHEPRSLESLMRTYGAPVVEPGQEQQLTSHVRATVPPRIVAAQWAPMRSAYWLLLFAGCLIGEWWLRRRSGLS